MISAIEKTHGDRFGKFAQLMEQNRLFVSDVETGWICLNLSLIHIFQGNVIHIYSTSNL